MKKLHALNSATAFEPQTLSDTLRVRRLARAGFPLELASILAPLAFGEARS